MSNIKFDLEIKFGSKYGKEEEAAVLKVLRNNSPTYQSCPARSPLRSSL